MKKLENQPFSFIPAQPEYLRLCEQNNCFLVDWLTVTFHGVTPQYVKWLLGLDAEEIPWQQEEKFRNGYPVHWVWNNITISYGADDVKYYSDTVDKDGFAHFAADKVRTDMGVCLTMSGQGCRAYESYGRCNWQQLFRYIFHDPTLNYENYHVFYKAKITRLDIAYDDHIGILDMLAMRDAVEDREYRSKSTKAQIIWSDDEKLDIQGLTIYVGSKSSPVFIRIYDKAAERGFSDMHWIRVELQMRDERAMMFAQMMVEKPSLGVLASGVLRNYLCFVTPVSDTNKSRWPLTPYWDKLLLDMERCSLWVHPGEEYNASKCQFYLLKQWSAFMRAMDIMYGSDYLIDSYRELYPTFDDIPLKYQEMVRSYKLLHPDKVVAAPSVWDSTAAKLGFVDQLSFTDSLPCDFSEGL